MYKFRTMKVNTPDIRNEDGSTFNSEIDHRLTSFGKILRKLSIDEIPQILNVIKGDMSLIGPRPDMPDAIDLYGEKYISKLEVRPGITGLNQAHFRNSADLETRFKNDVYYVRNYSFLLDAKIFVKTILVVLSKKNIYK